MPQSLTTDLHPPPPPTHTLITHIASRCSGIVPHLLGEVLYIVSMRVLIAVMPDLLDQFHPQVPLKGIAAK